MLLVAVNAHGGGIQQTKRHEFDLMMMRRELG